MENASRRENVARIPVLLSAGMAEMAPALSAALGAGFDVTTEPRSARGVMLTGPVGPAGVAFLRVCYPQAALLVIDRRWRAARSNEVVVNLEAGADGYLANPTLAEVASHVQALARRYTEYNRPMSAA